MKPVEAPGAQANLRQARPQGPRLAFPLATFDQTVRALRAGRPAVFPTETVFGLGVAVRWTPAPRMLFDLKGRPEDKPVSWLVADAADIEAFGRDVPDYVERLARAFCPGPITLIVRASDAVPEAYRARSGTIGLRVPASADALALIRAAGCPLATTSANPSGAPAPRTLRDLDAAFARRVGCVYAGRLAGAQDAGGAASTVIDCTGGAPRVVREGPIGRAAVARVAQGG